MNFECRPRQAVPAARRHPVVRPALCACLLSAWLQPAAAQKGGEAVPIDFYGKLYPEWLMQRYGTPSARGTVVGNMGTLRNDTTVLAKDASPKADTDDHEWSNSYVAVRGRGSGAGLEFGYDLQALIDLQGNMLDNLRTRDAFAYVGTPALGRLAVGRMDSIYKEFGDRVRMLGITSGNFVSTSRVLSGVGWRGRGETTFHNRRSNMVTWYGPRWGGVEIGASHSFDAARAVPGGEASLRAAGIRWGRGPWYAALATEVHRDWLPVSMGDLDSAPAAESILNRAATAASRDQAWRLSFAWSGGDWRVATDWARLRYTETDAEDLPGKFRRYRNATWAISAEYKWSDALRLAANHARGSAGSCELSAGVACSTQGLGGHQTSLGAMYRLTPLLSVFALASHYGNRDAAYYGSAPQGGSVRALAAGVKLEY
jgi:predicted porin